MEQKIYKSRIVPKGDIEANWDKAIGFIPKDKEIIIYKADAAHPVARFKIGDGVTAVQDLGFSGADMVAIEKLVNEKGELLIEYVDNAVATIIQILDNKLDKTGGLVGGDLSVQGNLNVTGTTTTKDTETILIKDNVIVANSDGNELLEEAGFAVKTGAAAAYGIMYDPVGDGVKIGLGSFDESGKFEYTEGEDQFLATRDDEIADGHLVKWDDTTKKLVDAGTVKTNLTNNTEEWTSDDKAAACETIGALPKKFNSNISQSIIKISKDGEVTTNQITSEVTSSAVVERVGSGNIKVPETPTDNSFATSKKYVDDNFVAKPTDTSGFNRVYGIAVNNNPLMYNVQLPSYDFTEESKHSRNGLAQYRNGSLGCSLPLEDYHTTNKKYVDDLFASVDSPDLTDYAKLTDLSSDAYIASLTGSNGQISVAGLFKYEQEGGFFKGTTGTNAKSFRIKKASFQQIDARAVDNYLDGGTYGANYCFPIVSANIDYALFSALTNSKANELWNFETFVTETDEQGYFKLKGLRRVSGKMETVEIPMYIKTNNEIWEVDSENADLRKIGTLNSDNTFIVSFNSGSSGNRYAPDFIQYKYVPAESEDEKDKIYTVDTRTKALDLLGVTKLIEDLQAQINELKAKLGE